MSAPNTDDSQDLWPYSSSELAGLIRHRDWAKSPLGPVADWPATLRVAIDLMLESPNPSALLWGPEGYLFYNDGYIPIAGGRHPHILGERVVEAWPEIRDFNLRVLQEVQIGQPLVLPDQTLVLHRHADPEQVWLDLTYSAIPGQGGQTAGVLATLVETTARRKAEQQRQAVQDALRISEDRLLFALDAAGGIGTWDWDIVNDLVYANAEFANLYSVDPVKAAAGTALSDFVGGIHPEDRDWVGRKIRHAVETAGDFAEEYRLQVPGGPVRWVFARGRAYHDEHGRPVRFPGVTLDITERKASEQDRKRLAEVVENSPDFIGIADLQGHTVYVNPAGLRLVGADSLDECQCKTVSDFFVPEEAGFVREVVLPAVARDGKWEGELHLRHFRTGDAITVLYDVFRVDDPVTAHPINFVTITRDITARKKAEEELRQAKEAAESANQAKSQFLANMSHELRTPLNAIIGYSEMLQEEAVEAGATVLSPDLQKINAAGKHLLGLINDVLDLSKIEAGKMDLYLEDFDVAAIIREVADTTLPLAQKNGNQLRVQMKEPLGVMRADLTKVRQSLFNLLSNACKFTREGTVTLDVERSQHNGADWIRFRVADNGIGIPREKLGRLFEPFSQGDAATSRRFGGTGLGLALTRRLCRLMGGDIAVVSEAGHGSAFTIELPVHVSAEKAAKAITRDAERSLSDQRDLIGAVLVVDDDPTARELMQRTLEKENFLVVTASSGPEALRLARELRPRAITLDVMMPGMDGWQVLGQLKADPLLADIPVIMVTIIEDRNFALSLGASDYLTKPVDRERLVRVLQRYQTNDGNPVLVVDDDADQRRYLRKLLEHEGYQVNEAENGAVALRKMEEQRPSLILLDLLMPEMDGFEFVSAFREHPDWRGVPIVVLTSKEITAEDRERLNGQVMRVLPKGLLDQMELLQQLRQVLARQS